MRALAPSPRAASGRPAARRGRSRRPRPPRRRGARARSRPRPAPRRSCRPRPPRAPRPARTPPGARERATRPLQRNARTEPPEREQRRPGRRRGQAAARLELGGELPRDRGREPAVALHQLDEPPAAELEQRRVADRLDRRRARRARQQRQLADRGSRTEHAQRPLASPPRPRPRAAGRGGRRTGRRPRLPPGSPSRLRAPARVRVRRERLERLRVRARQERHAGQRRDGHARRAQRSPRSMRRSYAAPGSSAGPPRPGVRRATHRCADFVVSFCVRDVTGSGDTRPRAARGSARAAGARALCRVRARVDGVRPRPRGVPRRRRAAAGGDRARRPHLRRAAHPRGVRRPS